MVDFVLKLIKDIDSQEEKVSFLAIEYNKLKDELFDLENFIPEEGTDIDKEFEKIDAKIHSVKLKMKYIKDALIELDSLDLIEKKDNTPKVQFTIHNEKIKKRVDSDDDEAEIDEEDEEDDDLETITRDDSDVEERYESTDEDEDELDEDELDEDEPDEDEFDEPEYGDE